MGELPKKISGLVKKIPKNNWATYTEHREPNFKVHNNLGHAKNAVNIWFHQGVVGLYELVDGEWLLREEIHPPTCYVCKMPGGNDWSNHLEPTREEKDKARYQQKHICSKCRRSLKDKVGL